MMNNEKIIITSASTAMKKMRPIQDKIARQTEEFLSKGNAITKLEPYDRKPDVIGKEYLRSLSVGSTKNKFNRGEVL